MDTPRKFAAILLLLVLAAAIPLNASAQAHACVQGLGMGNQQIWWTGAQNAKYFMDFTGGAPVVSTAGAYQTGSFEGTAVYTTPEGDLLLYTDGDSIVNGQTNALIGTGVGGNTSATEAALIIPDPNGDPTNDFYVFGNTGNTSGPINWTLVDIAANSIGAITPLDGGLVFSESLATVPAENGTDFWILSVTNASPTVNAYLVDASGVNNTPVSSPIPGLPANTGAYRGTVVYHPPSGQLAISFYSETTTQGHIFTASFDEATGALSNFTERAVGNLGYSVAFSPDGTNLFYSIGTEGWSGALWMQDVDGAATNQIATGAWAMPRLAPDGRVYVVDFNETFMGVINAPDNAFASIDWDPAGIILPAGARGAFGLVNQTYAPCQILNPNEPPVSAFTFSCTGLDCDFDGGTSTDSDGSVVQWDWDFGDGSTANGQTTSHSFAADGTYNVILTVTDDEGATNASGQQVTVNAEAPPNQPPVSQFSSSCDFLTCTFDGSASTDPDGTIAQWDWDFGDGTTGSGAVLDHTFPGAGTFVVILTVTDGEGATNASAREVVVQAPNQAPVPQFTASCDFLTCTFDASASSDPDGGTLQFDWDFGDGSTASGEIVSHTFPGAGTFTVTVTVTDDAGGIGTLSGDFVVEAPPPPPPPTPVPVDGRWALLLLALSLALTGMVRTGRA